MATKINQLALLGTGAQRVAPDGKVIETSHNTNTDFFKNLEAQMEKLHPNALFVGFDKIQLVELADLASDNDLLSMEKAFDVMGEVVRRDALTLLTGGASPESMQEQLTITIYDGEEPTTRQATLEDIEALKNGEIPNATFSWENRINLEFENGKFAGITDGMEDYIPEKVMEHAAKHAQELGVAINVVPFDSDDGIKSEIKYVLVDDEGNLIPLKLDPDSPEVEIGIVDPTEPTYNPSGNGNDIALGNNDGAPHIDNPTEQKEQQPEEDPVYGYLVPPDSDGPRIHVEHGSEQEAELLKEYPDHQFMTEEELDAMDAAKRGLDDGSFADKIDPPPKKGGYEADMPPKDENPGEARIPMDEKGYKDGTPFEDAKVEGTEYEPFLLAYVPGQPIPQDENALMFQQKANIIAKLRPDLEINLGKTAGGTGEDMQFGSNCERTAFEIEQLCDIKPPTGTVNENLMCLMDQKIAELQYAQNLQPVDKAPDSTVGYNA